MRVLWFTNVPLPPAAAAAGLTLGSGGGHWMSELLGRVAAVPGVELGVATAFAGLPDLDVERDGVRFYVIGQSRRSATFAGTRAELGKCAAAVRSFRPDLIHFHGSERFFGLLKADRLVDVPAAVSLQGILAPYSTFRGFFGALSPWDVVRATRLAELPLGLGLLHQYADSRRGARREARILGAVEAVLGRTAWDEAWARRLSPQAAYHRVGEILRPEFRAVHWSPDACTRHTLIYTNAGHPRRGAENLLAAVALLAPEFPGIRLRLAGALSERSGYGRFFRRRMTELGVGARVEFLGHLGGAALARALAGSHAFVISSYVENSPNSLAEAMTVGMPCVASYVGGIPSMVEHGRTGLHYPVDDVALLAAAIRRVFMDDADAVRLGTAAREAAGRRHDPATVTGELMTAYERIAGRKACGR